MAELKNKKTNGQESQDAAEGKEAAWRNWIPYQSEFYRLSFYHFLLWVSDIVP